MPRQIKLLLLIPHLGGGGAERVIALLAQHLNPERFCIHVCLIAEDGAGAKPLPQWVTVHRLHCKRVRHAWLPMVRFFWKIKPRVTLSGMAHLNFLLLALKPLLPSGTRILVRQNTTASSVATTWISRLPYRYLYSRADAILCQSEAMASDLVDNFGLLKSKFTVLANPIDAQPLDTRSTQIDIWPQASWPRLLTVARLAHEKGIDLLLRVVEQVRRHHPRIHAIVLGVGPEEVALQRLSVKLLLENAVSFPGFKENLADYYRDTTLFVLPSRHEGMPNALLEAAAAGLPIVATPCSAGLCDLLHGHDGTWLASAIDPQSLSEAILLALSSLLDSTFPPQRFEHAFLAPFELRTAIAAYENLIQSHALETMQ